MKSKKRAMPAARALCYNLFAAVFLRIETAKMQKGFSRRSLLRATTISLPTIRTPAFEEMALKISSGATAKERLLAR